MSVSSFWAEAPWYIRWRGREWPLTELEEPLRLCGRDPVILQEPAALFSPDVQNEFLRGTFRHVVSVAAAALGADDALLFFHPHHTKEDWQLAGRLRYDLTGQRGPHALLLAQRRAWTLLDRHWPLPEREQLIIAFLHGFARRFLEDQHIPPQYCPLLVPQGVFLEVVPVRSGETPPAHPEQEPQVPGKEASSGSTGWLLLQPWERPPYAVCSPAPAPASVQIDEIRLNRPYPWW
ncbi:MAG: hypothetical protein IRZ31_12905 [Thermogemmatispora sp.]|uniref:hypothetical protein n=1 Tax=Thermogemmatispora sp. TaxID=1968838 RepID=UPI002616F8B6|nr:hypothetical protein [Thermogemmatispora sp.]MBX5457793.1 hypothetical protein [Thermogemmatispora sp.]